MLFEKLCASKLTDGGQVESYCFLEINRAMHIEFQLETDKVLPVLRSRLKLQQI
jgi:hypothetical protein